MLTHMGEYWVLAAEGLTFFGAPKSVGPQQKQSKPNFVCDLRRLFLIFPQGEVFEVLPPEGLKGYYLPVFPIDIWSEIDSISRTMLPSDLCEGDANYRVARLPEPKLERELTDVIKASGYDSPLTRVLRHLVNLGLTTVRDVFEGDPDKLFPTASHRLKSRKVAVSLIATEIRRGYPSDFLGLEVNLLLRGLVERGWPPLENSDPAIRAPRYRVAELEKDFRTYPANLDGANLPVRQVKASAGSPKHLDLVLEGGVIVTVDEEFMAIEILVPFWRSDSGSAESGFRPISHSGYGRATLALLANYAGVIEGRVCDGTQEFVLPDFWPGKEIETRDYLSGGIINYVSLLNVQDLDLGILALEDQRTLIMLRQRAAGLTLEQIGRFHGVTREAVRQIIRKHGGEEFKAYLGGLEAEREESEPSKSPRD
jgi:hypothetical protein